MSVKHYRRFAREWAMQFLFQYDLTSIEDKGKAIDVFLAQLGDPEAFDCPSDPRMLRRADKAARNIINGVLENMTEIDKKISEYSSKWTIERMPTVDRNVVRVAVYEMLFCQNVPPVVSVNEAIEIAKTYGTDNTTSFINGVLDAVMNTLSRPSREAVPNK